MKFVLQEWRQMASAGFCMMLGLVALLTLPAASLAQEIKIGVVNTEKILRESIPAVMAQKKIEQEFQTRDARIKQLSSQAKALQQELESNDSMTEADRKSVV